MIKYFIEDKEGRWLCNPDNPGETWTRDPLKAWTFTYYDTGDIEDFVIDLFEEELDPVTITEHDFTELWNPQHLRDHNGDMYVDIKGTREFKILRSASAPVQAKQGFLYQIKV